METYKRLVEMKSHMSKKENCPTTIENAEISTF